MSTSAGNRVTLRFLSSASYLIFSAGKTSFLVSFFAAGGFLSFAGFFFGTSISTLSTYRLTSCFSSSDVCRRLARSGSTGSAPLSISSQLATWLDSSFSVLKRGFYPSALNLSRLLTISPIFCYSSPHLKLMTSTPFLPVFLAGPLRVALRV